MNGDRNDLDSLLGLLLAAVPDRDFTATVVHKIAARRKKRRLAVWSMVAAGTLPVLLFLPVAQAGAVLAHLVRQQATSPAACGLAALVLLWACNPRILRL